MNFHHNINSKTFEFFEYVTHKCTIPPFIEFELFTEVNA